jgi:hypothetical protein
LLFFRLSYFYELKFISGRKYTTFFPTPQKFSGKIQYFKDRFSYRLNFDTVARHCGLDPQSPEHDGLDKDGSEVLAGDPASSAG